MDIRNSVSQMDAMVSQGAIVDAVKEYFDNHASTSDYGDVHTSEKVQMIEKMEAFTSAIAEVKTIEHHGTLVDKQTSTSEFTFNFIMKDGSEILWHEIIKRTWNTDAKVLHEEYFKAN